jgi:hypothetical protein
VAGGYVPGGLHRNRDYYTTLGGGITIAADVDPDLANELDDLTAAFDARDLPYWVIGHVHAGSGIVVSA